MQQDGEIAVKGAKLRFRRDGGGEPLLFLHGAQGLDGWEPALAALAENFDVIAPDHPGYGRSEAADGVDDMADLALLYLDILETLGVRRVHLVGHCVGGWLATEIAVRNTSRLQSLTLVSSAGLRLPGVPRADMFICTRDELAQLLFAGNSAEAWKEAWVASPEQEEIYDRNRFATAKYAWQPRLCNPKLARWLHRIDVPTQVIWGEQDKVLPVAHGAAFKDGVSGATMTTIPACGHLPHVERPNEFAAAVTQFLRRAAS